MSEYYLDYTGAQLDDAINKVRSGYILPEEIINIVENVSNMDISKGKTLNVNVPVPDGYIQKSLLQSAVHYFDLGANKTGVSTVDSSWYSFTPEFVPKIILFGVSEYSNGNIVRISSSFNTMVMSWWFDSNVIDNPRYWGKSGFLLTSSTPAFNVSSNGTGIRYDAAKNKIYFYCSNSAYGLKAGTNSSSSAEGYYAVQYWG